ncbi:MAG TPA: hypothetical protein DD400_02140 [Rhodospirillaceae bacterium]|nr:hypothetical protein [Rhodospirillaceae bacterium]
MDDLLAFLQRNRPPKSLIFDSQEAIYSTKPFLSFLKIKPEIHKMPKAITPPQSFLNSMKVAGGKFSFERSLTLETPTFIPKGVRFYETNSIGFLSYLSEESRFFNTTIGRYCSIAESVFSGIQQHPVDRISTHPFTYNWSLNPKEDLSCIFSPFQEYQAVVDTKAPLPNKDVPRTIIGNDVWIGRSATIKPGITIGDGAVIGSHAVVTHDVAPYTIVAGVPARTLRQRFDDKTIEKFLKLQWWLYNISPLRKDPSYTNVELFLEKLETLIKEDHIEMLRPETYILENENGQCRKHVL